MKIICKDQKTKDLLIQAIKEFPDSFGHMAQDSIIVFGPDTLDIVMDKNHQSVMLDFDTINKLYELEKVHSDARAGLDEVTRARLDKMWREGKMMGHDCGGADPQTERLNSNGQTRDIMLRFPNTPASQDWERRLLKIINLRAELTAASYFRIQQYLTGLMDSTGTVMVTEEIVSELERIAVKAKPPMVALVGAGVRSKILTGLLSHQLSGAITTFDERAYTRDLGEAKGDFGRDSGKQSRRPMVTSATGHPYPLPKGPRGMPRVGRTRGR